MLGLQHMNFGRINSAHPSDFNSNITSSENFSWIFQMRSDFSITDYDSPLLCVFTAFTMAVSLSVAGGVII